MLFEARNIERSFFTDGKRYTALAPITLSVTAAEFLVVTGPSGAGKSTLLNLLSGLDRPSHVEVIIECTSLAKLKELEIAYLRN